MNMNISNNIKHWAYLCEDEETKLFQNESERYVLTMNKVIEALDKMLKEGKIDENKLRNYKFSLQYSYGFTDSDGGDIDGDVEEVDFGGDLKEFNSYLEKKSIIELLNAIKEKNKLDSEVYIDHKYSPYEYDMWEIDVEDDKKTIVLCIIGEVDYSETR